MLITADDYLPIARRFEGDIAWLYLDTVNKVTVGIGHMIPNAAEMAQIPMMKNGVPASDGEKQAAYATVAKATDRSSRGANAFDELTTLRISEDQSADLFRSKFDSLFGEAVRLFQNVGGGFEAWPKTVQLATFDMAYNLGPYGLYRGYPTFRGEGLAKHDWAVCAKECYRNGPGQARNDWTKQQFLDAAAAGS